MRNLSGGRVEARPALALVTKEMPVVSVAPNDALPTNPVDESGTALLQRRVAFGASVEARP